MVEERTMLLKKSYFSDISLTKQKILQRRHFISAAIRQGTQAGLLKPYEFLQVQESRPVSFIKFDSAFDPVANCRHQPALSFGRGVSQAAAASAHACFV